MGVNRDEVRRVLSYLVPIWLVLQLFAVGTVEAATVRVPIERGMVAGLSSDNQLFLEAMPKRGEGLLHLARRLCGTTEVAREVAGANGGVRRLQAGVRYRVPFSILLPEYQVKVVQALFSEDRGV